MEPKTKRSRTPAERERVVWLLDFLQRDVTTLRAGERLDLADDMDRLLWLRDPAAVDMPDAPDGYAFARAKARGEIPDLPWPEALALEAQTKLKAGIAILEAGGRWEPFTPKAVDGRLPTPDALLPYFTVQADKTIARRYHGSYAAIMLASAVDLLVSAWPDMRRCELKTCKRWFLPEHGRQRFHDPKCANLARFRKSSAARNYIKEEENAARRELKKKTNKPSTKKRRSK